MREITLKSFIFISSKLENQKNIVKPVIRLLQVSLAKIRNSAPFDKRESRRNQHVGHQAVHLLFKLSTADE